MFANTLPELSFYFTEHPGSPQGTEPPVPGRPGGQRDEQTSCGERAGHLVCLLPPHLPLPPGGGGTPCELAHLPNRNSCYVFACRFVVDRNQAMDFVYVYILVCIKTWLFTVT